MDEITKIEIYENDSENLYRYSLGCFNKAPLLCIGINPNTATPQKWDSTITRVNRITQNNGFDGWIMINLYPQRTSKPYQLDFEPNVVQCKKNIEIIENIVNIYDISKIWAAWGNSINTRAYLKDCLRDIHSITSDYNWINLGSLTKSGNPRHPSRLSYNEQFTEFDILSYINSF